MKTIFKSIAAFSILVAAASTSDAQVRVYVRTRPVEPVVVRPAAPYRRAVWIPGEWRWQGREYVYVKPHYVQERRGHVWVQGHWTNVRGGSTWVAGYWR